MRHPGRSHKNFGVYHRRRLRFAAVFLGSATLRDGEFHFLGTCIGVLIIAVGFNGLAIFGAATFYQYLF
jgi:ribose transport system permease protein